MLYAGGVVQNVAQHRELGRGDSQVAVLDRIRGRIVEKCMARRVVLGSLPLTDGSNERVIECAAKFRVD